jgi:hypothetical protein
MARSSGGAQVRCPAALGGGRRGREMRGVHIDSIAVGKGGIQASKRGYPILW